MEGVLELHVFVRGRVQGVFFRDTTKLFADQLGVVGTVRNLPDGSVEIIAQGSTAQLKELLALLTAEEGPGEVASVEQEWSAIVERYRGFRVVW